MYFYNFNIGDYRSHTAHLTPIEHYIYRNLIDWYYLNERPMPANDIDYIAKLLLLKTDEEKQALQSVLAEFFKIKKLKQTGDTVECYHHARIDAEIKNYHHRNGGRVYDHTGEVTQGSNIGNNSGNVFGNKGNVTSSPKGNVLTSAQRTAKSKAERKKIINDLQEMRIDFDDNASLKELREIYANFFANSEMDNGNTFGNVGNVSGNDGNFESNAFPHAITSNQEPITNNQSIYTPVEISVDNSDSNIGANPYPIFDPDIETLNVWFLRAGVPSVEDNAEYRQELTRFNLHFAGHTRQEVDGFWYGKMITWFKNVQNRKPSENTSHAPVVSDKPKPDPKTSVFLNGLWKPCLPGMTQQETYDYIKAHKDVGMSDDEVYDQVIKDFEVAI